MRMQFKARYLLVPIYAYGVLESYKKLNTSLVANERKATYLALSLIWPTTIPIAIVGRASLYLVGDKLITGNYADQVPEVQVALAISVISALPALAIGTILLGLLSPFDQYLKND